MILSLPLRGMHSRALAQKIVCVSAAMSFLAPRARVNRCYLTYSRNSPPPTPTLGFTFAPTNSVDCKSWRHRRLHTHAPLLAKKEDTVAFPLADIGEGITECELTKWFVAEGDRVSQFDKICEVQSDKAVVEITSRFDGVIAKRHYEVGSVAKVGTPLVDIRVESTSTSNDTLPLTGSKIDLSSTHVNADSENEINDLKFKNPVLRLDNDDFSVSFGAADATPAINNLNEKKKPPKDLNAPFVYAAPSVRALARELRVEINSIRGTGPNGRILREDVLSFAKSQEHQENHLSVPHKLKHDSYRELTPNQRAMFRVMTKANEIPALLYCDSANVRSLDIVRAEIFPEKTSLLPLLLKTFSIALQLEPGLNAHLENNEKVKYIASHNIGIAIDSPSGLVVPNLKGVENMTVLEISREISRLRDAAASNRLSVDDFANKSITVSNIGSIGGTYMAPIITPPEICIVALGRASWVPAFAHPNGQNLELVAHKILPISVSADHRVVDGATVARFIRHWKKLLETPNYLITFLK